MLTITGLKNFYCLPSFHDMRCKAPRISEIIRSRYHRDPHNGDVYIFMSKDLDDELMEIEHLCCLAHVRNKFKDAYNQGCEQARFFLEKIAALYSREDKYREDKLSSDEIKDMRNDFYTENIVNAIKSEMYDLLALPEKDTSPLLRKALNYLRKFWKQLFAYRNDGDIP